MADTMEKKIQDFKTAMAAMLANAPLEVDTELVQKLKNIEDLPLNEITQDVLIEQFYDMGEYLNVDTRQGSIYWDASMGSIIRTSTFLEQLKMVKEIISIFTCTGDVLDEKMMERGLTRNPANPTPATYYVSFVGMVPEMDSKMSVDDYFFTLSSDSEGRYILISEDMGTDMNNLVSGTKVIPELDVDGLISATLGDLAIPAIDAESDDSARERLINRISGPDENGNKSQVRTWCESVEGVGAARIIPLWKGPYTVKGVIISAVGGVPSQTVIDNVQNYIDPGCTGMGEGVANIGQFFTAVAVEAVKIDITVSVLKKSDATYSGIQEAFKNLLQKYFVEMSLEEYTNGMLGIEHDAELTIEERRRIVEIYYSGTGHLSGSVILQLIKAYTGHEGKVYWDGDTLCVEFNSNDSGFISLGILQKIISRRIPAHIPFQTKCTCKVSLGLSIETEAWEKRFIQTGLLPDVNMGLGIACDGITVKAAVQAVKTVYPVAGDSGNAGIYPIVSTELQTAGGDVLPKVKTESWKVVYPICGDALGI